MRFKWLSEYWNGVLLLLILAVLSLWLALRGKLDLYIHPRYIVFTIILCGLGVIATVIGLAVSAHRPQVLTRRSGWAAGVSLACLLLCAALVIVRPMSLTSSAASQRGAGDIALQPITEATPISDLVASDASYQRFSLKEWSSLLAQSGDAALFKGKLATLSGFVSPSRDPDIFYLSRFVLTCCAVDARPLTVPVYQPEWRQKYKADQWLEVTGYFDAYSKAISPIVLKPESIKGIPEPEEPYVY